MTTTINQAADILKSAQRVCVLTGAGVSAESGIATFRDKQTGLWAQFKAEDLASIDAFHQDPATVWQWYQWRRGQVAKKKPNPAHHALATWEKWALTQGQDFELITQNVDDLHEQAGSRVTHLHGNLWQNKCSQCGRPCQITKDDHDGRLRHCITCKGLIRPDIVWFGEMLPQDAWQHAQMAAASCDVFLSVGTSAQVYPAAGLIATATQQGAIAIEVNPNPTGSPYVKLSLTGMAGEVLPQVVELLGA